MLKIKVEGKQAQQTFNNKKIKLSPKLLNSVTILLHPTS